MSKARKRISRTAKVGLPPGTLVHIGERKLETARITAIHYDESSLEEIEIDNVQDCLALKERPPVNWINIDGVHDVEVLETLGGHFGLHPLVLEDIVNTAQRPKIEDHGDYVYVVLKMLSHDEKNHGISSEQVSLILGRSFVLSFQERAGDVFDPVRKRIRAGRPALRKSGPDYLAYSLLDAIVDNYFIILEKMDERIEELEDKSITDLTPKTLQGIHNLRRDLIFLGRSAWPLREILAHLTREDSPLIQEGTQIYLRDVYDHTVQVIDNIETFRERVSGVQEIYLSSLSNNMNSIMKFLTIIGTIFIPLTFIVGVYGMNFKHMPELGWKLAYPILWVVMVSLGVAMVAIFWKKKWL